MSRARQRQKQKERRARKAGEGAKPSRARRVWEVAILRFHPLDVLLSFAPGLREAPGFQETARTAPPGWVGQVAGERPEETSAFFFADEAQDAARFAMAALEDTVESAGAGLPDEVEVNHPLLLELLRAELPASVRVRLQPKMLRMEKLLRDAAEELLTEEIRGRFGDEDVEADGCDLLYAFYEASEAFIAAPGWGEVPDDLTLEILEPPPQPGMAIVQLRFDGRGHGGLGFWESEADFQRWAARGRLGSASAPEDPTWEIVFAPSELLNPADRALIEEAGLEPLELDGEPRDPVLIGGNVKGDAIPVDADRMVFAVRMLHGVGFMVSSGRPDATGWSAAREFEITLEGEPVRFRFRPLVEDDPNAPISLDDMPLRRWKRSP